MLQNDDRTQHAQGKNHLTGIGIVFLHHTKKFRRKVGHGECQQAIRYVKQEKQQKMKRTPAKALSQRPQEEP